MVARRRNNSVAMLQSEQGKGSANALLFCASVGTA